MPDSFTKPPHRLFPWIVAALILTLLLVITSPTLLPQLLGKLTGIVAGGMLGALLFDTLVPYARPSGFLAQPWHLCMVFRVDEPDFKIVAGKETLFMVCCALKVFSIIGGAYVVGLGN